MDLESLAFSMPLDFLSLYMADINRMNGTPRKTIDTLIATRCLESGHALLFSDRDFEPFVEHLGLVSGMG